LNVTVPDAISQRRVAIAGHASVNGFITSTIMEETPMKNSSTRRLTTFPSYDIAGQQFHTTTSVISSENDIDILNTTSTGPTAWLNVTANTPGNADTAPT
jgi:hypothetical protein